MKKIMEYIVAWAIVGVVCTFVFWIFFKVHESNERQAANCIADGGQWVQISRDYFKCMPK